MKQRAPQPPPNKSSRHAALSVRSFPPDLPASAWLTLDEVLQFVPISRTSWFRGVATGQLPRPEKIGRLAFWKARDIRALLEVGPRRARTRKPPTRPQNAADVN
jgi:prophage regulatory protein